MLRLRRGVMTVVLAGAWLAAVWPLATSGQGRGPARNFREAVLLRTEANAIRRLESARAHLKAGQWDEAIPLLRQAADQHGDTWVPVGDGRYLPVQVCCELLFSTLSPEALTEYRRRIDPQARRWFEQASATRDEELLSKLVRQAFASSYGDDALWLLGELAFERGHMSRARGYWSRLLPAPATVMADDWPQSAVYPDSGIEAAQVRARLVLCSLFEGDLPRAQRELEEFGDRHSNARGTLAGRTGVLGQILEEVQAELRASDRPPENSDTATFGGNPERNKVLPKTYELGGPLWSVRLKPYPAPNDDLLGLDDTPFLPTYFPAVAGNLVILCDETSVYAFDLYGGEPAFPLEGGDEPAEEDVALAPELLQARIYQLPAEIRAQAGRLPFLGAAERQSGLGVPAFAPTIDHGRAYVRLGPVTGKHDIDSKRAPRGYLVCLDLTKEGKHVGTVDSESITYDGGRWTFEGAPVVAQDRVCIGLRRHKPQPEVAVACFDAALQRVLWVRDVCLGSSNPGGDALEVSHQVLSVSGDRVYFNTNLGAVAALDLADGSPQWITTYEHTEVPAGDQNQERLLRQIAPELKHRQRLGPNPCVIHGDAVFVAPYDCPSVLALEAATGRVRWQESLQGENVPLLSQRSPKPNCLLGVAEGKLIAAGDALWAIDIATGKAKVIGHDDPDPAKEVFGRGLLAAGLVYTTSRETLFVREAATGRADRLPPQAPPAVVPLDQHGCRQGGNLTLARGVLLVAQPGQLTVLGELASLRKQRQEDIARNQNDPRRHLDAGLVAANPDEALRDFDTARRLSRESDVWEGLPLVATIAREQHQSRMRAGQRLQDRQPAEAAAEFLKAADVARALPEQRRALQSAAVAFTLAEKYPEAVAAWQRILDDTALRREPMGLGMPAGLNANRQIGRLLQSQGREVYAGIEVRAQAQLQKAEADPEQLQALFEQYPHSQTVAAARIELAQACLRGGQAALALRTARQSIPLVTEHRDRAQVVAVAAQAAEQLRHMQTARDLWATLGREFPKETVAIAGTDQPVEAFVAKHLADDRFRKTAGTESPFLARAWERERSTGVPLVPRTLPADPGCRCVLLADEALTGLALDDGRARWSHRLNHRPFWSSFAGDWLITGGPREITALDPITGQEVWQQSLAGKSFRVEGRRVLCQTAEGTLRSYAADDGRLNWEFRPQGQLQKHWQVAGGRVLLQTLLPAQLVLLNSSEGSLVTVQPGPDTPWLTDPVVLADEAFAVVTGPQEVEVYDSQSASRLFVEQVPGRPTYLPHRVVACGADLLIVHDGQTATRVDPHTGRAAWSHSPRLAAGPVFNIETAACVDDQRLFVASEGLLRCFEIATGKLAWEQIVGDSGSNWSVTRIGPRLLTWPQADVPHPALVICEPATGSLVQRIALPVAKERSVHSLAGAFVIAAGSTVTALE